MKKKPITLFLASFLMLYFPVEWCVALLHGKKFILGDLLFSFLLPLILLVGLIRVTKAGWYILIACGVIWGVRDLYIYYSSVGQSLTMILIHFGVYLASLLYFIHPRIRHLYFDPRIGWWRSKPRYETHMPVIVKHTSNWFHPILRNISEGGCFIESSNLFAVNDKIDVTLLFPFPLKISTLQCQGEIRWNTTNAARTGFGVQFKNLNSIQIKALRLFVHKRL